MIKSGFKTQNIEFKPEIMKNKLSFLNFIMACCFGIMSCAGSLQAQIPDTPLNTAFWSIVASYTIPGKASGLAWDGTYIYFGIYGLNGNNVYRFNPADGTSALQCTGPFDDAFGLTFKGPDPGDHQRNGERTFPVHTPE